MRILRDKINIENQHKEDREQKTKTINMKMIRVKVVEYTKDKENYPHTPVQNMKMGFFMD